MDQILTKFIKFLVLEAIQVKKLHLTVKIGPVWKSKIFDPSGPPKPKIGPQGPDRAQECQEGL